MRERDEIVNTKDGAVIASPDSDDDEEMDDDIDEEPINPLPQNWKADPREAPENINEQLEIKVTRNLQFARKLKLVENWNVVQRRR